MANAARQMKEREMIRLGDVIIDPSYQVRKKLSAHFSAEYAQLLRTRKENPFPEIVVEKKTYKLVCGFTRMDAYRKVYSPDTMVPVLFKSFKNSADRLFYAVADNSTHGQRLDSFDKKDIILRLVQEGVSIKKISYILGWKIDKVSVYEGMVIVHKDPKRQIPLDIVDKKKVKDIPPRTEKFKSHFAVVNGKPEPLKRGLEHLDNKVVSTEVYENIKEHYSGWNSNYHARQLIMMIDDKTINLKDEKTVEVLSELCRRLREVGISC